MNARVPTAATLALLHAGYAFNEDLKFDLYGVIEDGEHIVEAVMIAGTTHNVTTLLRGRQMVNMGLWLDLKDGTTPTQREWAERHRHHATAYTD
jgi:hypothetical protein